MRRLITLPCQRRIFIIDICQTFFLKVAYVDLSCTSQFSFIKRFWYGWLCIWNLTCAWTLKWLFWCSWSDLVMYQCGILHHCVIMYHPTHCVHLGLNCYVNESHCISVESIWRWLIWQYSGSIKHCVAVMTYLNDIYGLTSVHEKHMSLWISLIIYVIYSYFWIWFCHWII